MTDDGLGPGCHLRPPGVDVGACQAQGLGAGPQVQAQGSATATAGRLLGGDAQALEQAGGVGVEIGAQGGLGAAA